MHKSFFMMSLIIIVCGIQFMRCMHFRMFIMMSTSTMRMDQSAMAIIAMHHQSMAHLVIAFNCNKLFMIIF